MMEGGNQALIAPISARQFELYALFRSTVRKAPWTAGLSARSTTGRLTRRSGSCIGFAFCEGLPILDS